LENLDTEVEINTIWETIRENIKISAKEILGYYELEKHKPWFDEPDEINGDNLNNVRHEASRHFRDKKKEYVKDKINEPAMNSKNNNIRDLYRGISEFTRHYHPRNNLVEDRNGDLLADSNTIVNRWKSYFSQLLNVHNISDVRLTEIYTAEPLSTWSQLS
jgi:hypothetical protein